jgi:hypothetical protein
MSWLTITVDTLKTRNAGAEVTALQESALGDGQTDPVVEIIQMVTDEVRGYIATANIPLGAGATIPSKLLLAAINRIRFEAATRLPGGSMLDDDRRSANDAAVRLLERVADGKFAVEEPTTEDDEDIATSKSGCSVVAKPTRKPSTRDDYSGL